MKWLILLSLLLQASLVFAWNIPNKCESEKLNIESLKQSIEVYNAANIFPIKKVKPNLFTHYFEAIEKYSFLLSKIEESFLKPDSNYDQLGKVNTYPFNYNPSCMKISKIRNFLRFNGVQLPGIPEKLKKEITVAVVDTGIDLNNFELTKRMIIPKDLASLDFSGKGIQDQIGHGSHVTGLILAVFPYAKILPLNYYNPRSSGQKNLEATVAALNYAIDQNVDIINYSGGGPEADVEELRALKKAEKKGILVIAAAGNERSNIDNKRNGYYPASYGLSNVIVVGNVDQKFNRAPSSNYGKNSVHIMAFGLKSFSFGFDNNDCSALMTGTSQATPLVTGAIALLLASHPEMTVWDAKKRIMDQAMSVKYLADEVRNGAVLNMKELAVK